MRALPAITFAILLGAGLPAVGQDSKPGSPEEIQVNAMRDPEVRKYAAILAGLDAFDTHHGMAPKVPALTFRIEPKGSAGKPVLAAARLGGDGGFSLPLAVDANDLFTVPRSRAALDANSELVINQKRRQYRVTAVVNSPGLPANVRRLGDLRLECRVQVAIIKEEIPLWIVLTANTVLRTRDWCGFEFDGKSGFRYKHGQAVRSAVLVEGNRSALIETEGKRFRVPLADRRWSDDALIELEVEPALTGTAGETPRTVP